jgi:hypothetical protein
MMWSEDVTALFTCFGMEALTILWRGSDDTDEDEKECGDLEREIEEEDQNNDSDAEALDMSAERPRGDCRVLACRVYGVARI